VSELRQEYPLRDLLKMAGLARSTFYYQQKVKSLPDQHEQLKASIQAVYDNHRGRYGYRRITTTICKLGTLVNHKKVRRLMGELGIKSLVRPKKYRSYRGSEGKIAENLLNREFEAEGPNQKWVTDVTEFKVAGEKLFLSPVLDLYNGEIIAFETARRPEFAMVGSMLEKALAKLGSKDRPILHSDQGWQYQMPAYQRILQKHLIKQSMSRKGNCYDNAVMENFFGILKSELFYLKKFTSLEELQKEVADYIHYYNYDRIKLKLKGLSPVQYRTQPS